MLSVTSPRQVAEILPGPSAFPPFGAVQFEPGAHPASGYLTGAPDERPRLMPLDVIQSVEPVPRFRELAALLSPSANASHFR